MSYITYRISISLFVIGFLIFNNNVEAKRSKSKISISGTSRSNVKLRIPEPQRMKCLAKLLCGVQMSATSTSSAASTSTGYANQAFLLKKYFETYPVAEPEVTFSLSRKKKPFRKDSVSSDSIEDPLDLDDDEDSVEVDIASDESEESPEDNRYKKKSKRPSNNRRNGNEDRKRDDSQTTQKKKKKWQYPTGHIFDLGVPIIEKEPPLTPRGTRQHEPTAKPKSKVTFASDLLTTVRGARQLAAKNVRNCNVIEGCSFTFKQIFVSLQEDSNNIMGNENIVALSDLSPADVTSAPTTTTSTSTSPPTTTKSTPAPDYDKYVAEEEDEPSIFPILPSPSIIIKEDEDELDDEPTKINSGRPPPPHLGSGAVEDLFLTSDFATGSTKYRPKPKRPTPPPPSNLGSRPIRTTPSTAPTTRRPKPKPAYKRPSPTTTKRPAKLQINNESLKKIVNYQYKRPGQQQGSPVISPIPESPPPPPGPLFPDNYQLQNKNKKKKRPTKYEFPQDDEDYDESRDTYDEEAQFEPLTTDVSDESDDFDDEINQAFNDEKDKKKKKQKNKKNKNKKNKNKKDKNKGNKKQQGGQQGWVNPNGGGWGGGGQGQGGFGGGGGQGQGQGGGWGGGGQGQGGFGGGQGQGGFGGGQGQGQGGFGGGQGQGQGNRGWGPPPQHSYYPPKPHLTEIGGRPLVPEPEKSPISHIPSFNGATSGWHVLYRNGITNSNQEGRTDQKINEASSSDSSSTPISASVPVVNPPSAGGGNWQAAEDISETTQRIPTLIQGPTPIRTSGFSIEKLTSPFTSLVKLVSHNGK